MQPSVVPMALATPRRGQSRNGRYAGREALRKVSRSHRRSG